MQALSRLVLVVLLTAFAVGVDVRAQTQTQPADNPAEAAAYRTALNTRDAAKRAQAIDVFLAWYPNSALRIDAFEQLMAAWQVAGDPARADSAAVRLLQLDPDNVRALANRAFIGRTRAMAGEAAALAGAVAAAERGQMALAKWPKPATLSDADFARQKLQFAAVFGGTLGFAALQSKDYERARAHLLEAVIGDPDNLQDVYQLSLALLESTPLDPLGFWYAARAIALARLAKNDGVASGIEKYGRGRYLRYHGGEDGWEGLLVQAGAERQPPGNFAATISRALSPAEAAVQAVADTDPGSLSFSDWETVLRHRDDSPANRLAADKVWRAISNKQRGGTRLKIPVKVISATPDRLEAAITEDNQASNSADLIVTLAYPLSPLPAAGAAISIVGTISDYQPRPFRFVMTKAELADESLPIAGGMCADPRPAMCTLDYRPACGERRDGSRKTYSNGCSACADPEVLSQGAGVCP